MLSGEIALGNSHYYYYKLKSYINEPLLKYIGIIYIRIIYDLLHVEDTQLYTSMRVLSYTCIFHGYGFLSLSLKALHYRQVIPCVTNVVDVLVFIN